MQDYATIALSYYEKLSDLKCRYADLERRYDDLERHCKGLESKLSKTRGRMKMYRERCRAWESALSNADRLYWGFMSDEELKAPSQAYGVAVCTALIRKEVAPTYPSADCAELRPKVLNDRKKVR